MANSFEWWGGSKHTVEIQEEVSQQLEELSLNLDGFARKEDLEKKQDKMNLVAGNSIKIEEKSDTGETIISYIGTAGGITEEQAKAIAEAAAADKIAEGNYATKDDIPQNISDLNNDSGFVTTGDLSPIAVSGDYSDLTGTPAPYDDTDIKAALDAANDKIKDLEDKTAGFEDAITVSENFGKLTPGKTYPPGTTLEDIIKDILDPAVPPTIVEPSLAISGTDSGKVIASGDTLSATITLAFDRGSISTGGYRAGEAIEYSLDDTTYQTSNVFNVVVSETNKSFKGYVRFAEGDQPKDSKGNDDGTPLAAGKIESDTLSYVFASPVTLYSNAANILTVVKESTVRKEDGEFVFHYVPQTEENPEIFDVPAAWTVLTIETINDLNGQWESVSHNFDISDVTHDGVAYKRYTDNREFDDGGRDIKITWS